jgi:hypothetical protein
MASATPQRALAMLFKASAISFDMVGSSDHVRAVLREQLLDAVPL